MATRRTARSSEAYKVDILTCPVCEGDEYRTETLGCGHTMCVKCLKDQLLASDLEDTCYVCIHGELYRSPVLNSSKPRPETVQELHGELEAYLCLGDVTSRVKCRSCPSPALRICLECEASLCEACARDHVTVKQHDVIDSRRYAICPEHSTNVVTLYCLTCTTVACRLCAELSHATHTLVPVNSTKLLAEKSQQLRACVLDHPRGASTSGTQQLEVIAGERENLSAASEGTLARLDKLQAAIVKRLERARHDVRRSHEAEVQKLDDLERQVNAAVDGKRRVLSYMEAMLERRLAAELVAGADSLPRQLDIDSSTRVELPECSVAVLSSTVGAAIARELKSCITHERFASGGEPIEHAQTTAVSVKQAKGGRVRGGEGEDGGCGEHGRAAVSRGAEWCVGIGGLIGPDALQQVRAVEVAFGKKKCMLEHVTRAFKDNLTTAISPSGVGFQGFNR